MLFFLISTAFQCKHWGFWTKTWSKKFPRNGGNGWNSPTQNLQESVPCFVPGFRRGPWLPFPRVFDPQHETVETPSGIFNGEPPLSLKIDEFTCFSKKNESWLHEHGKNMQKCKTLLFYNQALESSGKNQLSTVQEHTSQAHLACKGNWLLLTVP